MLTERQDIIGDLARLQRKFLSSKSQDELLLDRLEVLAAAAAELGMSHTIIGKASGIPRARIEAVLDASLGRVGVCASEYERVASGTICRRDR